MSQSYRYSSRNRWAWWNHDEALEILRERYARGEITKEQYVKMREDLKNENWGDVFQILAEQTNNDK